MPRNHVWLQIASTHAHVQGAATAAARVTADVARTAANRATQGASRRGAAADGGAVFSHRLSTRGGRQDGGRHKRQCSKSNREYQGSSHFEHWLPSPCAGSIRRQMSSVSLAGSLEKYHVARRHATSSQVLTVILPLLWRRTSFHRDGALATERARALMCPWVAGSSPRCGATRRMGALVVIGFYTLDQPGAEVGEFSFAHSADVAQRFLGCRPDAGQLAERRVVQDYECGDAAFNGYFAAECAEFFEEGFVDVLPRVLLDFGSGRFGLLCFQQPYRALAAHHFP